MSEGFNWDKHMKEAEANPAQPTADQPPTNQPPAAAPPQSPPPAQPGQPAQQHTTTKPTPPAHLIPGQTPAPAANPAQAPAPQSQPQAETPAQAPAQPNPAAIPAFDNKTLGDEKYVPAHIPEELRSPTASEGKYKVGDGQQETEFIQVDENAPSTAGMHIDELLKLAFERKASDFHITAGLPPMIRLDGELVSLNYQPLTGQETQRLLYEIISDDNIGKFENTHELDCSYTVKNISRFRVNMYMQRNSIAAALRLIPNKIPPFDELRLPGVIRELSKRTSGLILVTGPTGSGKTTTIASMLDDINERMHGHILTIEDPIEYLHQHKRCMVNQREMHSDTYDFHSALRAVLREDPDIILVGELRDHETIEAALTLAETGHLVFGTLHTRNAPATIDRIIDVFPADAQDQIRVLLSNTLEAVISQQLLPKLGGGRRAALEIMVGLPSIRNLIREGKTHQMYSVIETSSNHGMNTMDKSLAELFRNGECAYEECLMRAVDQDSFARLSKGIA